MSDHRYMRSGFAFLTDGMETQGILLALTSKRVYSIVLRQALSFEEHVSIDGQSINSCWEKSSPSLWATRAHVGWLQNMEPCDCRRKILESSSTGICFSMSLCSIFMTCFTIISDMDPETTLSFIHCRKEEILSLLMMTVLFLYS